MKENIIQTKNFDFAVKIVWDRFGEKIEDCEEILKNLIQNH